MKPIMGGASIPEVRATALAVGLISAIMLSACGSGTADDSTATAAASGASSTTSSVTPSGSPSGAASVTAGDSDDDDADNSNNDATCDVASAQGNQVESLNGGAAIQSAKLDIDTRVTQIVVKLHPSNSGTISGMTTSTDTNDPIRVNAVLRGALASAAVQYPNNPFATPGAQATVQIHHQMSGGATVIALGVAVRPEDAQALLDALTLDPTVDYADLDRLEYEEASTGSTDTSSMPDDTDYSAQWNLTSPNVGINMPAAWAIQKADPSVITAIIDSGYLLHNDLDGNRISTGITMTPSQGIVNTDAIDSGTGHGTKVAGTMSAVTDNAKGIAGVGWNAKFVPINVFGNAKGADNSDIADAIRWAIGMPVPNVLRNPQPVKIINLSLGSISGCNRIFQSAIDDAVNSGVVVVTAAGNDNLPAELDSPGNCRNVINVAGTNREGKRWVTDAKIGSNYGGGVTVSAPSTDILTTTKGTFLTFRHIYDVATGTSLAAPQVAGVIALMLSANPTLTPRIIRLILIKTANKSTRKAYKKSCMRPAGAGIVDAGKAVDEAKSYIVVNPL